MRWCGFTVWSRLSDIWWKLSLWQDSEDPPAPGYAVVEVIVLYYSYFQTVHTVGKNSTKYVFFNEWKPESLVCVRFCALSIHVFRINLNLLQAHIQWIFRWYQFALRLAPEDNSSASRSAIHSRRFWEGELDVAQSLRPPKIFQSCKRQ